MWLFTAILCTVAALWWLILVPHNEAIQPPWTLPWWALLGCFLAAERVSGVVELAEGTLGVDVTEAIMIVGLVWVAPVEFLVARLLAHVISSALKRRINLDKHAFNLGAQALQCGVFVTLFRWVLGPALPTSPRGWGAALVVSSFGFLVSFAVTSTAIRLVSGHDRQPLRLYAFLTGIAIANGIAGAVAVQILWSDWRTAWMVVGLLAVGALATRSLMVANARYKQLSLPFRFTGALSGVMSSDDVAARSLEQATELLRARHALLIIELPDGALVRSINEHGAVTTLAGRSGNDELIASLLDITEPLVVPFGERSPMPSRLVELLGWIDLVAAPIPLDDAVRGVMVVGDRHGDTSFDAHDGALLATFAQTSAVAFRVGDLIERLRAEAADKEHRARHDALTGLPNRTVVDERITSVLPHAHESSMVAVMFMDLDGFKDVNDALGHHVGDELLKEVGRRLRATVNRRGVVARLGGDEFAVVLAGVATVGEVGKLAGDLRRSVAEPIVIDRLGMSVSLSIGIALAPLDGLDARTLFQRADVAMYAAKGMKTGVEFYDPRHDHASARTLSLSAELRTALELDQLQLHYQPQARLDGTIVAVEALARWPHPRYGSVPPDEFVAIAEQHGMIHLLTRWAIRRALSDLGHLRLLHPQMCMSVNISARDLIDVSFVEDVRAMLAESSIEPNALMLELTESQVLTDTLRSAEMLQELKKLGIRLAVDDFGTGHSSLMYLRSLPVDEVKIDKSFVLAMATRPDDAVIVKSTIDLAHNLGLRCVAEGVEDSESWDMLVEHGCDIAQGYYLTPALPLARLEQWLFDRSLSAAEESAAVITFVPRAS